MTYTKREIRKAGEIGELFKEDIDRLISYLDEAKSFYTKYKAPPNPLTQKIIEMYNDWYMIMMGVQPKITVQDGAMAKQVAKYLSDVVIAKNPTANDSDIVWAWQLILTKYPMNDKFYGTQLKLSQIGSNLNNLIALIKKQNGTLTAEGSINNIANIIQQRSSGV